MNDMELADTLAAANGFTKTEAQKAVDGVFAVIAAAAAQGEEVSLKGFGKFKVKDTPAREGRNPVTGATIHIAASRKLSFAPAKTVMEQASPHVGAELALADPAILRIAKVIIRALPAARRQVSEATIERFVDALIPTQDPIAPVSAEIDAANADARVRFMGEIATLTAEQVTTAAGSTARNRSQTASRWKAEGKIFSIPWRGGERYPAFQFKDGRPIKVIADILGALPSTMSPWETAFWFVSTNSWLDDAAPCNRLGEGERVVTAALREAEDVLG